MLILNQQEVGSLLDLDQLLEDLGPAMADFSAGSVLQSPRTGTQVPEHDGILVVMPAYLPSSRTLVTKLVSIFPQNAWLNLPTHLAIVAVFDSATGSPLAIMDGTKITALRTAAGSALATRFLARPDSTVLAVLGTGVQARAHAQTIPRVRSVREVRIAGRDEKKAATLAQELSAELGILVQATESYRDAVMGADIVCVATHSPEPVLRGEWLEPGTHVNSVGLNFEGRELDDEAVVKALVVVESRQAALAPSPSGANDLIWPIRDGLITEEHIVAEVGDLVSGTHKGRTWPHEITLYKSVGVAVQDAVAAQLVMTAAQKQGIGVEIDI